jgi:uncharacterized protein
MIARIGQYESDESPHCYVHGYVSARLFKSPLSSSGANSGKDGLPVCICATTVDGIVLALTPFNHNYTYRSSILHGHATLVPPDSAENLWAMQLLTDGVCPQRWDNCRTPPDKAEITATRILKVRIDSASAKVNDSGVKDDKKDLVRSDVTERTWTGVLPVSQTIGEAVPHVDNKVANVPGYIEQFRKEFNERGSKSDGGSGGLWGKIKGGGLW